MGIKYSELVKFFRVDADRATAELKEGFESKQIRPNEFNDFGALFEECFGYEAYKNCKQKRMMANGVFESALRESQGAVSTAAFLNITGQILYSTFLDAYQAEEFAFTKLIPEVPTAFLDGEKIAGLTAIGDEVEVRKEGDPYSLAGFGEDWIFTPATKDRGVMIPITWEAVFADRTGQVLSNAATIGTSSGINREKRAIDCCIDENTTAHRYNWRGTVIASYGDNSGTHSWDNLAGSNGLVDWTDVDAAEQVFNALVDPFTGEPIMYDPRYLTVTKQLEQTARRILSATEIRVATPGYAVSANPTQTNMANPYLNKYELLTSRLLAARLGTDTSWFLADWSKYANYMVVEKMSVVNAPPNNPDEFERRIVQKVRVNERGAYVVKQPRAAVKSTA